MKAVGFVSAIILAAVVTAEAAGADSVTHLRERVRRVGHAQREPQWVYEMQEQKKEFFKTWNCGACSQCLNGGAYNYMSALVKAMVESLGRGGWVQPPVPKVAGALATAAEALCTSVFGSDARVVCTKFVTEAKRERYGKEQFEAITQQLQAKSPDTQKLKAAWDMRTLTFNALNNSPKFTSAAICNAFALCPALDQSPKSTRECLWRADQEKKRKESEAKQAAAEAEAYNRAVAAQKAKEEAERKRWDFGYGGEIG